MVVAAAGADEPVAVGDGGERGDVIRCVGGIIDLDPLESEGLEPLDEQTQRLLLQILLRVREDGYSAERGNELHRLQRRGAADV